jgi:hypothetical protein
MSVDQLQDIVTSLDNVSLEIKQTIYDMSQKMTEDEIICSFNQQALDLFTVMAAIIKELGRENEIKVASYKILYDNAIKINYRLPVDKFTYFLLAFAADIYSENEERFLGITVSDSIIQTNLLKAAKAVGHTEASDNEFGFIRSEMFKSLWKLLDPDSKELIKSKIILLTSYAHAYLYKIIS